MYRRLYRGVLSRFDAETLHLVALAALEQSGRLPALRVVMRRAFASLPTTNLDVEAFGLRFAHPLGLAAGFDKDARALPALAALGFSFVEVGTVTPLPQPGHPRPRLFRLSDDNALINRMGFPSAGVAIIAERLGRHDPAYPIFISLGKNKDTPLLDAARDYVAALQRLYPHGAAFVVNISSPNTPELRRLQTRAYLSGLLDSLITARDSLAVGSRKPLLIKIAPDLDDSDLALIIDTALDHGIDGMIATNTTLRRAGLTSAHRAEAGGLSGRPLLARSTAMIRMIRARAGARLTLIGVGGIFNGDDLYAMLDAGATLAQAYTGFIYEGPTFVAKTLIGLRRRMERLEQKT